ncbi:MAG: hypothetical protein ACXW4U_18120, partial [Anaerolineales bacterium]
MAWLGVISSHAFPLKMRILPRLRMSSRQATTENPISDWLGLLPFFAFILAFLILPSLNLFLGAFRDIKGNFTLENINFLANPYVLKSYAVSLQVSVITSLVGGIFGFFVAYSITVGNAPRWMRNILMTFSGLAANFG